MVQPVKPALPCLFILLFWCTACATSANEPTDPAVEAAEAWLARVDQGEYAKSWEEAAPAFKQAVSQEQWEAAVASVRGPLGKVEARELLGAQFTTTLPGAPDGAYLVIQFKTRFANKAEAVETITPMKDVGGLWKVSGYFVK
jgi:hypothetical protein